MPQTPHPVTNPHSAFPGWVGSDPEPPRLTWRQRLANLIRRIFRR